MGRRGEGGEGRGGGGEGWGGGEKGEEEEGEDTTFSLRCLLPLIWRTGIQGNNFFCGGSGHCRPGDRQEGGQVGHQSLFHVLCFPPGCQGMGR